MVDVGLRAPDAFDPEGDGSTVSLRWNRFIEAFESYADAKGLFDLDGDDHKSLRAQRRAMLLYIGGPGLREIFRTLADTGVPSDYKAARTALETRFTVTTNKIFQRHLFRKVVQNRGEPISQFVGRLRTAAATCEFANVEDHIRDQVVETCNSDSLRRKFLEKGNALTLAEILQVSATHELVETRSQAMSFNDHFPGRSGQASGSVNKVSTHKTGRAPVGLCFRCGRSGCRANNPKCVACDKLCSHCGIKGHFRAVCKQLTGEVPGQGSKGPARKFPPKGGAAHQRGSQGKRAHACVQGTSKPCYVDCTCTCDCSASRAQDDLHQSTQNNSFVFHAGGENGQFERVVLNVGGVHVKFVVDSGADCNLIPRSLWEKLKRAGIKCTSKVGGPNVFVYGSTEPLPVVGTFMSTVSVGESGNQSAEAEFVVIDATAEPLLGINTSKSLGLLKIGREALACSLFPDVETGKYEQVVRSRYPKLFDGLGKAKDRVIKLTVDPEVELVAQPFRRVPFAMREPLEAHLKELLDLDVIEEVPTDEPSPWASPCVIVPKPGTGKIRLVVDMRTANQAIVRHRHPMPSVDELLLDMSQSRVFSKIDLVMGFHQFVLQPSSRPITTFTTHVGLFRYKRLNFGVNAAPEIYQKEIARVIAGIPGVTNLADDVICHAKTKEEHDKRLFTLLKRLEEAGLTINDRKSIFGVSELEFCGHKLTAAGLKPSVSKAKAISEAKEPETVGVLVSLLGLASYCSKFIAHFSTLVDPLRKLVKGKDSRTVITLSQAERVAFQKLKAALSSSTTLAYFDATAPTKIIADASPVGLGAILIQKQGGDERIVCYASRTLTAVERRYCQTEKEALALVWACERFHSYVYGLSFELVTDHKPLLVIYGDHKKRSSARIQRWVLRLQPYDFTVDYVKGYANVADYLSRSACQDQLQLADGQACMDSEDLVCRLVATSAFGDLRAITVKEIERESAVDLEIVAVRKAVQTGDWDSMPDDVPPIYRTIAREFCVIGFVLLRGDRVVIPRKYRKPLLDLAHEGHLGIVGTKRNLRSRAWWPRMDQEVEAFVKTCHECQITGNPTKPDPVRVTALPGGPWQDLACDYLGPLSNGDYLLVVVDYYSRYYEVRYTKNITSGKTIELLSSVFDTHGLPISLKTDNATNFASEEFGSYCEHMGIDHVLITPRWPAANGEVERQNRSLMKRVKIAFEAGLPYKQEVQKYLTAYRNTPHSITGKCPAEVLFGRKLRTKLPSVCNVDGDDIEMRDRDAERKLKGVDTINSGRKVNVRAIGDQVLVQRDIVHKTQTPFDPHPYTVVAVHGSKLALLSHDGRIVHRNVSRTRPYYCPTLPSVTDNTAVIQEDLSDDCRNNPEEGTVQTQGRVDAVPVPDTAIRERPTRERRTPAYLEDYIH